MPKLTNNQIDHFNHVDWLKDTYVIQALGLIKVYMFASQERQINQLGPFEKPRLLIMVELAQLYIGHFQFALPILDLSIQGLGLLL
jgi:hypothetical protein